MVFCGLFPIDADDYPDLRDALEKLSLNDAALLVGARDLARRSASASAVGFLGLLHMDIVRERLEREYDLELLTTMPSVEFEIDAHRRQHEHGPQPGRLPRPGPDHRDPRADGRRLDPRAQGVHRADHGALPGAARAPHGHALPLGRPRPARPTSCRWPRSSSTSSTSSSRAPGATPRSTTRSPTASPPTWSSSTSCSPASRRRALDDRAPRQGLRGGPLAGREAAGEDPAPAVRRPGPGGDRRRRSSPARPSRRSART